MCRISGIVNHSLSKDALERMVKEMCDILKHGGPDDEGIYVSTEHPVVLGHRRLSLIDLSEAGHQPMSYQDGRYQISYNGEIYNYLELKDDLKNQGFYFKTNSDTEVILAAFAAWGIQAFSKLNGMFAFALWDNVTANLYLVRDTVGIKPLYYAVTSEGIAFASEIKAFKPIPYLQEENDQWKVYLMAYRHLPEPVTTLQHVKHLPKGSFLQYHAHNASVTINTYAYSSYSDEISNRQQSLDLIKENLRNAVNRHMISDAPIGVFLSGGVDSSLISLLASDNGSSPVTTLSLFFKDGKYSEKRYQDIVQQRLKGRQCQHLLSEQEFHTHLPSVLKAMDQPSCDGINTWFISKQAKDFNLKAVLSGIGGDELFGGYPSFERMQPTLLIQELPDATLRAAKFSYSKKIRQMSYLSIDGILGRYLFLRGQFIPCEIAKQLNATEKEVFDIIAENASLYNVDNLTPWNQASWMEMNLYMQNQLLRDADVMSMTHGVEIRVPFLDKEFTSLLLQIKSSIKRSHNGNKQLLIDSFKTILPEAIWNRPKMGFSFPYKEWLINSSYVKNKMNANNVQNAEHYQLFISGKMHWSKLMTFLLLSNNNE